jgi:peroxiredoxin
LRFESPLSGFQSDLKETLPFTPVIDDYYSSLANVKLHKVRDWLITNVIISGYSYYPYEECEFVYNDFINKCKTQFFADTLTKFHTFIEHFRPGEPAPDFILTNELGENIALSSLQGKVLYVDFWGVGCAPCRSDIIKYVPKLHEKYKGKDVAFVNICVDSNEERWKKAITDLNLGGINLIAEGWTNNPICKLYNIKGIPHYVILDKKGKYVSYNGSRPWELISDVPNDIDKALKQ